MRKRLVRIANAVLDIEPYLKERELSGSGEIRSGKTDTYGNESLTSTSPAAIEAIRKFLENRPLQRYPDPDTSELRARLSEYASLPARYIDSYAGSRLALEYIFRTYLETGTELIAGGPVAPDVKIMASCTGAKIIEVEHSDYFNPTIEEVVNRISSRTRAVYLGNPYEVTGSRLSEAELVFLLAYAERSMVIVDEEYFEFSRQSVADLVPRFPNLAVVRSISRGFGLAGLRAGYIISDPENLNLISRIKGDNGPDSIAQIAALAALENVDHAMENLAEIDQSRKILANNLPEIGYEFRITPADFVLIRFDDTEKALSLMKSERIRVRDLSYINRLSGYLRITIGTPDTTEKLLLVLSRTARELATGYNRNRLEDGSAVPEAKKEKTVSAT